MNRRRINLPYIILIIATAFIATACPANDFLDDCNLWLKQYLEGQYLEGEWPPNTNYVYPPCDERQYEDLKKGSCPEVMMPKVRKAHALCQSIKATQRDFDDCNQTDDAKLTKIGCTRIINDQSQSLVDRAFAFVQVGNSYMTKEHAISRAGYYYTRSIELDPTDALIAYAARAVANWKLLLDCHCPDNPGASEFVERAIADYRAAQKIDAAKMDELTASSDDLKKIRAASEAQHASTPARK